MNVKRVAGRWVTKLALRGAVTMTAAGSAVGYSSNIIDLRDQLPRRPDVEYRHRVENEVDGIVWHHSATRAQTIRSIADYHTRVKGWPEIGYHYAVGHDGRIYQLLDVKKWSNHAQGYNRRTIGVVLIGNYHEREMPEAMKSSVLYLQEYLCDTYNIDYVWLHRDTKPTACPGNYASEFLKNIQFGPRPQ
jgi:hypothetical protein